MNALVTGGLGFIGSNVVSALLERGDSVTVIDDFSNGNMGNIEKYRTHKNLMVSPGNVGHHEQLKRALNLRTHDVIFHLAGVVDIAKLEEKPYLAESVNHYGSVRLMQMASEYGIKKIVLASTAAVYGDSMQLPRREDGEILPRSAYAVSKARMEEFALKKYRGNVAVLRFFNVYGSNAKSKAYSGVINVFAKSLIEGRPINIYGEGHQSRDFIHVSDIVRALLLMGDGDSEGLFNVGTGIETTVNELLKLESKILGREPVDLKHVGGRKGDTYRSYADISKIRSVGFTPKISLEAGLIDYLSSEYKTQVEAI